MVSAMTVLAGFTIGVTADRRADEQCELLRRRGATVVHGPTIETRNLADSAALSRASQALIDRPPAMLLATTGLGIRSWFEAADGSGQGDRLRSALANTEILARGPKAAGALHTAGLWCSWQAPGERNEDLLAHLTGRRLDGLRVAVQLDGGDRAPLVRDLRGLGADVVEVPVYRWMMPSEPARAHRLIDAIVDGRIDAMTVTSAPALGNMLRLAAGRPDEATFRFRLTAQVLVAVVGPVCAEFARRHGVEPGVVPSRFRIGPLVKSLAEALDRRAWSIDVDGLAVSVRGGVVDVDGTSTHVTRRTQQLLDALARADGAVLTKAELARTLWHQGADPHAVEVTVARTRALLGPAAGAIVTVPRRGYRLAGPPRR